MAVPTQLAVFEVADHNGASPVAGSRTARLLDIGAGANGTHMLTGADVAAGALAVPLMPGPVLVTGPVLTVETIGEEPVITVEGSGDLSITIGAGPYAGTYATRHDGAPLTTTMVGAAPTCLLKPVVTGVASIGNTLSITPGLWVYGGPDPGDQSWVQKIGGVSTGETDLDYVIQAGDAGQIFTAEETFGGVTVISDAILLSA